MDWFKDTDGVWCRYVSPTETITAGFGFSLGEDANCDPITIVSHTIETQKPEIVSDSLSGNTVTVQVKGVGDIKIILTLSSGDVREVYRRYKESSRSENF